MFYYVSLHSEFCDVRYNFRTKQCSFVFTSSCLYDGLCLIYVICVWLYIMVSNTYCIMFFVFVLCCQFLRIVLFFLLDLWNSLTFIQTLIHCMYALILFFFNVLKPHSNWMLSTYMSQNNAIHTQLSIYSHFIFKYLCTSYLPGVLFSGELNFPTV